MRYDKEAVLNAWAAGRSCAEICDALDMDRPEAVSVIVQRARRFGDLRAMPRRPLKVERAIRPVRLSISMPKWVLDGLTRRANRVGLPVADVCRDLLTIYVPAP